MAVGGNPWGPALQEESLPAAMGSHLPHPARLLEERTRWCLKKWVEAPGSSGVSGMVPLALEGTLCFPAL